MNRLILGDNYEALRRMPSNYAHSIVTDGPYGLGKEPDMAACLQDWIDHGYHAPKSNFGFMSKSWDAFVPQPIFWKEVFRVLKPGGHVVSFGGTRTYDLMVLAIRLAGFEIRDQLIWCYGGGFPKSHNVGKSIDLEERNRWENVSKEIDNSDFLVILESWKDALKTVSGVVLKSEKSTTETGMSMQKRDFAARSAPLIPNLPNNPLAAIIVDLKCCEVLHKLGLEIIFAPVGAENYSMGLTPLALPVEMNSDDLEAWLRATCYTAPTNALPSQREKTKGLTAAEEALMTWLGSQKSSKMEASNALCVAILNDLKHTILNLSKTFQSLGTMAQTECASAITVTTIKSIMECLISFTAGTLKNKAIDKQAGAEREVVGRRKHPTLTDTNKIEEQANASHGDNLWAREWDITAPATQGAQQWDGWGTALSPSHEPIVLARKPLEKGLTVAQNVLKWGCGALNIDGCRIGTENTLGRPQGSDIRGGALIGSEKKSDLVTIGNTLGRWPSNLLLANVPSVLGLFPENAKSGELKPTHKRKTEYGDERPSNVYGKYAQIPYKTDSSSGSASRYFFRADLLPIEEGELNLPIHVKAYYCSKPSKYERNLGVDNRHPTIKPVALMHHLVQLVTPPKGVCIDPFMGSGTTGIAANLVGGLLFIGIEMERESWDTAKKRIDNWPAYREVLERHYKKFKKQED